MNKYLTNSTDFHYLSCEKSQITTVWETNVNIDVQQQSDFYGCLNENCCEAMIVYIKSRFDFLSVFCVVNLFYLMVAIRSA